MTRTVMHLIVFNFLACGSDANDDWLVNARKQIHGTGQDIDLDRDGLFELHVDDRFPDGVLRKAQFDYDQNGIMDAWLTANESSRLCVADLNHDGLPDQVRRSEWYDDGFRRQIRLIDTDRDGSVDTRLSLSWYAQSSTALYTSEILSNGELWLIEQTMVNRPSDVNASPRLFRGTSGAIVFDASCDPGTRAAIEKYYNRDSTHDPQTIEDAFDKAVNEGRDCLSKISSTLATDYAAAMGERPSTVIACHPVMGAGGPACAEAPNAMDGTHSQPMVIVLNSNPALANCETSTLDAILFHETMHYATEGEHQNRDYNTDQIVGCTNYCFGSARAQDCAACLAESGSDQCSEKSSLHSCSGDTRKQCFDCGGREYGTDWIDRGYYCMRCNGMESLQPLSAKCCNDSTICSATEACGLCGDVGFCSRPRANTQYCADCEGKPTVLKVGEHCPCPASTPIWNPVQKRCEGTCPGGDDAGGDVPVVRTFDMGRNDGTFIFSWQTFTIKDQIVVKYEGNILFDTGCVGSSGSASLTYQGIDKFVTVQVIPDCAGETDTAWTFAIGCP